MLRAIGHAANSRFYHKQVRVLNDAHDGFTRLALQNNIFKQHQQLNVSSSQLCNCYAYLACEKIRGPQVGHG